MTRDPGQGFCATQLPVTGTCDDLAGFIHFFIMKYIPPT